MREKTTKTDGRFPSKVIYLHGLASSPASIKAKAFKDYFDKWGMEPIIPNLNEPSFSELTISRALECVVRLMDETDPANGLLLMGSSFGGLVASFAARERCDLVDGLCLMAPAFDMKALWHRVLGSKGKRAWRERGFIEIDHPAYSDPQRLNWQFYEDAVALGTEPMKIKPPSIVFHGKGDDVVDSSVTARFGEINDDALVYMLEDGHDLGESVEFMAEKLKNFLVDKNLISDSRRRTEDE